MLNDSIYMKCREQANPQKQKAHQWLQEAGKMVKWRGNANGAFQGVIKCSEIRGDGCTIL